MHAALRFATLAGAALLLAAAPAPDGARVVPARLIPVPTTVSRGMQANIARPLGPDVPLPASRAQIERIVASINANQRRQVAAILHRYPATIERRTIAGVTTWLLTPSTRDPALDRRLLVHVHGGAYALFAGFAGLDEALLAAHYARTRVLSIDYRMPPAHPFPAAVDDAVAVWRALLADHDPKAMALFGTSAGGGLALATTQRLRASRVAMPAAIFAGTPWADLTRSDDSQFTNDGLDDQLGPASLASFARLYAGAIPLTDPRISPIYGSFAGFPPTLLFSGTRDLFLSMTVRTHRKLRAAGATADLVVFEAQSHAEYLTQPFTPESAAAFGEVAHFFDRELVR